MNDDEQCESTYCYGEVVRVRCVREIGHEGKHFADQDKWWSAIEWWSEHEEKR